MNRSLSLYLNTFTYDQLSKKTPNKYTAKLFPIN